MARVAARARRVARAVVVATVMAVVMAACGEAPALVVDAAVVDAAIDAPLDAAVIDARIDAGEDAAIDADDAAIDAVDGAVIDGAVIDAAIDAVIDGAIDAAIDAPIDAPTDAAIDAPGPWRIGHTTPLGMSSNHLANKLLGEPLVVPTAVTLDKLGVLVITSGPEVRLALYRDSSGAPGALVAGTAPTAIVAGAMELPLEGGPVALAPGTYWIMGVYSALAHIGYSNTTGAPDAYRDQPAAAPLPDPFGPALAYSGDSFNYWLVVE